jgi:tRNA (guanosine-2'-O-)-methyltransferase
VSASSAAFGAALAAALGVACALPPSGVRAAGDDGRLPERASVATAPELCGNALDDNGNGLADEGCGVTSSTVSFLVAWDEPGADVDLRVTDPNGELVEVGRPTESGLVKERDCPGRDGECRGKNLENVYQEQGEAIPGKYLVRVVLVSLGGAEPPVHVRFSARLGARAHSTTLSLPRAESDWQLALSF